MNGIEWPPVAVLDGSTGSSVATLNRKVMGYESLLESIGGFGLWQVLIYAYIAYDQFFESMVNMAIVFLQLTPEHYCMVPISPNSTWSQAQIKNFSVPVNAEGKYSSCHVYDLDYERLSQLDYLEALEIARKTDSAARMRTCNDWHYDRSVMTETIVTQWNLVCDNDVHIATAHLVYVLGFLLGTFMSGILADSFGRKRVFLISAVLSAVFGILQTQTMNFPLFLIFRFLLSLMNNACYQAAYVLSIEITTTKYRVWVGGMFYVPYALGYASLAVVAYFTRNWRTMHLFASAPILLNLFGLFFLPESPRWLLSKGLEKEAEAVLHQAMKINGRSGSDKVKILAPDLAVIKEQEAQASGSADTIFAIFKHKILLVRYVNMFFIWFVNVMVYYGISLNVSWFSGDVFLNNGLSGLVEVPAYLLTIPFLMWGRKRSLCFLLLAIGLFLSPVPWLPSDVEWLKIPLIMVAKLGITTTFAIIYVYTSELYPTVIRNSGLCINSVIGRLGSMAAPYIMLVGLRCENLAFLPITLFAGLSILAGLLVLVLPETLKRHLPETFEDAIKLSHEYGADDDSEKRKSNSISLCDPDLPAKAEKA